jgi:hypothetical protein
MVMMLLSVHALAQEIGSEIAPVTPEPANNAPVERQREGAPRKSSAVLRADGMKSAGAGVFGIRASFGGGQAIPEIRTGASAVAPAAGSVGVSYWATDALTLLFDVGGGLGIGSNVGFGFFGSVGLDYHFRTPLDALRPLVGAQIGIGSGISPNVGDTVFMSGQVVGGAEFFFAPAFSISGRLGIGVRFPFSSGVLVLSTVTPSIAGAWYF